jgi:hypothetical protein
MATVHFLILLVFVQIYHALPDEGQLNWAKLDKNEESVALNADLDKLNIGEKTLLAEHIMRTAYQLCNYQKKFSIPNGHSIPLLWLKREVRDYVQYKSYYIFPLFVSSETVR